MAENIKFINQVKLPNGDAPRGIQTYHDLTIGDQIFNGSKPITITATNLGLSQALKFVGSTNINMTEETAQTIQLSNGNSHTASIGDVVLSNGNGEFAWLGSNWEELGSENSYALKTIKITAGNGLSNGGTLTGDVRLDVNFGSISNLGETTSAGSSNQVARADHVHGLTNIQSNVSFTNNNATFTSNATNHLNGKVILSTKSYGTSAPSNSGAVQGQIYFKLV